jgi:hypothetical protein
MHLKYPRPGEVIELTETDGLVFGKIKVIDNGYEITPWKLDIMELFLEEPDIKLSIFRIESKQRGAFVKIEQDGDFYWIIPRGTYLLYHTRVDQLLSANEPITAFQVPFDSDIIYLGTLTMYIESSYDSDSHKQEYSVETIKILDDFGEAKQDLINRYPDSSKKTISKHLMVYEPAIRNLFWNYSRSECEKVLSHHGLHLLENPPISHR